jgi:regulatory protein
MQENEYKKHLIKAMSYCAHSEKCEWDVRAKLREWGAESGTHDKIVDYLIENKFIDHVRYTNAYVNDAIKLKGWGRIKIRAVLRMKNISSSTISEVFQNINEIEYQDMIRKLLETRFTSSFPDEQSKLKAVKSLYSRGYEPEIVIGIINNINNK